MSDLNFTEMLISGKFIEFNVRLEFLLKCLYVGNFGKMIFGNIFHSTQD